VFENMSILPLNGTTGFHMNCFPINDRIIRISSSGECNDHNVLLIKARCLEDIILNDMKCRAYFISVDVDRWWFWKNCLG
jgi:hypothetical protein